MTGIQQAGGDAPLKLRAHDAEDLQALATCLQDALVPLADVVYLKAEKRFVMIANRFMWERGTQDAPEPEPEPGNGQDAADARFDDAEPRPLFHRVNCAVYFDWVQNVRFRGLDPREKDQMLSLLTVEAAPGAILLVFSGGGAIRLEVRDVRCHLEDLGEPWPTRWRPDHAELETT